MSKITETIEALCLPLIESNGFSLVDLEFVKEGKNHFLRFALDKPGGIDLDDCAFMSEKISDLLDQQDPDPIPQAYFLEVSSPGAERPLKSPEDFQAALGSYIHLSFYKAVDGQKFIEGVLKEIRPDSYVLTVKDKTRRYDKEISQEVVAKARLAIEF